MGLCVSRVHYPSSIDYFQWLMSAWVLNHVQLMYSEYIQWSVASGSGLSLFANVCIGMRHQHVRASTTWNENIGGMSHIVRQSMVQIYLAVWSTVIRIFGTWTVSARFWTVSMKTMAFRYHVNSLIEECRYSHVTQFVGSIKWDRAMLKCVVANTHYRPSARLCISCNPAHWELHHLLAS